MPQYIAVKEGETAFPLNWITVWSINKVGRRTELLRRQFSESAYNEAIEYVLSCRVDWKRRSSDFRQYTIELH